MAKRYPKSDSIQDATTVGQEAYVMWGNDPESQRNAMAKSSESLEEFTSIQKSTAATGRRYSLDYSDLTPQGGSKPGLTYIPESRISKKCYRFDGGLCCSGSKNST